MRQTRSIRIGSTLAISLLLVAIHSGCGSTTKVESRADSSVGQQLLDLEKAHNQGIVSDKEYEKLRKSIVQKND